MTDELPEGHEAQAATPDEYLPDTWFSRDRPVLVEIMRQIESDGWATSEVVGKRLDMNRDSVRKALLALHAADYIDEEAASGHIVQNVSAEARRELGVW